MRRTPPGTDRRGASCASALAPIVLTAVLLAAGCASVTPPAPPPVAAPAVSAAELEPWLKALLRRDRELVSMQSGAVMEYSAGDRHVKAREQIAALRPSSLRVEAMSPFGVALILAARGKQLEIFEPTEHRFIRAAADADTLERYVQIPMEPAEAVGLLMGLAPKISELAAMAPEAIMSEDGMTVASWRDKMVGMRELGFEDGRLAMVRQRQPDGRVVYEVRYSEYRDIGGLMFAYLVDADFPLTLSHVTFRYERPIVNGAIDSSTFVLTPPPGVQISAQAQ
jgi:outer membrane lipoprotein-sorting protein